MQIMLFKVILIKKFRPVLLQTKYYRTISIQRLLLVLLRI
jgi:hypothetical protein